MTTARALIRQSCLVRVMRKPFEPVTLQKVGDEQVPANVRRSAAQ